MLNQLNIGGGRAAHLAIKNSERSEQLAPACEQRPRPHGTNSIRQHQVTIVIPNGVAKNIGNKYRSSSKGGSAAGSALGTDIHRPNLSAKARKTGRRGTVEALTALIREPNCTERAIALGLNQARNNRKHLGQRRSIKNQFQKVKDRLSGKECRFLC